MPQDRSQTADLPEDGTRVTAYTHENLSDDLPPRKVTGLLLTRPSPFGGRQCFVGGVQVDRDTVRPSGGDAE